MTDVVFDYDADADVLYYRLTRNDVARAVPVGNRVTVDVDENGEAVGIEVLSPPGFSPVFWKDSHPGFICGSDCPEDCSGATSPLVSGEAPWKVTGTRNG